MCTLSFARAEDGAGWSLFFNRDEARSRAPEIAPTVYTENDVRCVAPTDSAAGGTWITANEYGLAVALLNGYVATRGVDRGDAFRTRGELVRFLGASHNLEHLTERLEERDRTFYRPFVLFVVDSTGLPSSFTWNGAELTREDSPQLPLSSSAAVQAQAKSARLALFEASVGSSPNAAALDRFHRSHEPERGALSPCMHREDAATRSMIRIDKTQDRVIMRHEAGAPCDLVPPTSHELRLALSNRSSS